MAQHAALWQELLAELGLEAPLAFILENEGALGTEVLERFFLSKGLDNGDLARIQKRMPELLARQARMYLQRHGQGLPLFPGVRRILARLARAGVPAALVTSSRRALVSSLLEPGVLQGFAAVVCAEDVTRHKPYPDPYLAAAQALGQAPPDCLAVENAPAGIASARAAGATCFAVCTTLPRQSLSQAQAVFPSLWDLASHLGLVQGRP
jgi:beta-phosphoglucomutase